MAEVKQKVKEKIITSPKGVAKWAKLNKPDTKFNPDGDYSIELLLDPQEPTTQPFIDMLEAAHEAGYQAAKKADPKKKYVKQNIKVVNDTTKNKETGEETETGLIRVSFKTKASGNRKDGTRWNFRPALYDAKGNVLPSDILIYGGSVIKVAFSIRHTPMKTGAFYSSFNLKAVQVIDLKTAGSREASFYGFGSEAGYEADNAPASNDDEAEAGQADGDASDF